MRRPSMAMDRTAADRGSRTGLRAACGYSLRWPWCRAAATGGDEKLLGGRPASLLGRVRAASSDLEKATVSESYIDGCIGTGPGAA
jgi:hypothetical protein